MSHKNRPWDVAESIAAAQSGCSSYFKRRASVFVCPKCHAPAPAVYVCPQNTMYLLYCEICDWYLLTEEAFTKL